MLDPFSIKGIIFDYGGTLDTGGDHWAWIFIDAYAVAGVNISFDDFRDAYISGERAAAAAVIQPYFNFRHILYIKVAEQLKVLGLPPDLLEEIVNYCYEHARQSTVRVTDILASLSRRYPLALVSNFYGNLASVIDDFGLSKYFTSVIDSAVVGLRKPDPEIFRLGCQSLSLSPSDVLVVGDSVRNDILPAQSIGCHTLHINGRQWGG